MIRNLRGQHTEGKLLKQKVYVKSYGGAKIGDLRYHAVTNMEYNPHHIIVHIGTNEIRTKKPAEKIAEDIISLCDHLKNIDNSVTIIWLNILK